MICGILNQKVIQILGEVGDLSSYAQAAILDKYGTPFILKDTDKVSFEKPEVAFDEDSDYGNQVAQYKFLLQSGIFPEMTATPTGNTFAPAAMLALGELDGGGSTKGCYF